MPNTYTQLYIQLVFVVKGRENVIPKGNREELHRYLTGITTNLGQKMLSVFCMPDHTHMLIALKPNVALSDIVRTIKASSSKFINEKGWIKGHFYWQEGFAAFSYSRSQLDKVVKYIANQEKHHEVKSFKTEYIEFLKNFDIEYDEKYLFEFIE